MTLPSESRPNILIVVLDDVGQDQIEAYDPFNAFPSNTGAPDAWFYPDTKNLARIGEQGVQFVNAYSYPVCSPTRACLWSGRYGFRTGVGNVTSPGNISSSFEQFGVPLPGHPRREVVLADVARKAGYKTGFFGKWHLGLPDFAMAPGVGKDRWLGWDHIDRVGRWDHYFAHFTNIAGVPVPITVGDVRPGYFNYIAKTKGQPPQRYLGSQHYATKTQVEQAAAWISDQTEPFLAVWCATAAHAPYQFPPTEFVQTSEYVDQRDRNVWANYSALVEVTDVFLGLLLDSMNEQVAQNTVVIVMADNGTPRAVLRSASEAEQQGGAGLSIGPIYEAELAPGGDDQARGYKRSIRETGIRIPFVVSGPIVGSPGRVSRQPVDAVDVFRTCAEIMGVDLSRAVSSDYRIDGRSFLPILRELDGRTKRQSTLSERFAPNGDWTDIPPDLENSLLSRGYSMLVERGFPPQFLGRYKLNRVRDAADEFFHLNDVDGNPIDPFEQSPIDYSLEGDLRTIYLRVAQNLDNLVGPTP